MEGKISMKFNGDSGFGEERKKKAFRDQAFLLLFYLESIEINIAGYFYQRYLCLV